MSALTLTGDGLIQRFSNQLGVLGANAPIALSRALNHTGAKAKTLVIRNLVKQTGLKRSVIVKAVKVNKATAANEQFGYGGRLTYTLTTRGGDISLKFFDPKEVKGGVSAKPRGRRQMFAGTFTHGGRFPSRVGPVMGVNRRPKGSHQPLRIAPTQRPMSRSRRVSGAASASSSFRPCRPAACRLQRTR